MKYLVIGDASSMHIYNFVKTFLLPKNYSIFLLTLSNQPIRETYRKFYRDNNISVFSIAEKKFYGTGRSSVFFRILNFFRKFHLWKEIPQVDVCHVHSVYKTAIAMVLHNKKKFRRLILSYWGGDIEDISPFVVKLRKKAFAIANTITVTVKQTYLDFQNIYGHDFDDKLLISRFGTDGLNQIKKLSEKTSLEECRNLYRVPSGKICVTCGYSAYADQHQDLCLAEMMKMSKQEREKIYVIIPMQYGRFDIEYIERVEDQANRCDFPCLILNQYVSFEESAKLAIATDFYIHVRNTDAFSNTLKEQVYASSKIITGSWLHYWELDEMGASLIDLNSINELARVLEALLKNYSLPTKISLFSPIYELYSTESIVKQWEVVLNKALQ